PALSDAADDNSWSGETGFIHSVFFRHYQESGTRTQAFLCGPPPMIDGALSCLETLGVPSASTFYDKF
ncbi:CDP-6-deoxy-delta-3,4-glucoseen reductase, partial [Myxococcota bacterium]|nr:CDP-6-deoxy-delta-3,4-glucoseen reductase [Myxococcota bacterium]